MRPAEIASILKTEFCAIYTLLVCGRLRSNVELLRHIREMERILGRVRGMIADEAAGLGGGLQ